MFGVGGDKPSDKFAYMRNVLGPLFFPIVQRLHKGGYTVKVLLTEVSLLCVKIVIDGLVPTLDAWKAEIVKVSCDALS